EYEVAWRAVLGLQRAHLRLGANRRKPLQKRQCHARYKGLFDLNNTGAIVERYGVCRSHQSSPPSSDSHLSTVRSSFWMSSGVSPRKGRGWSWAPCPTRSPSH